jgi:hypothetical protein
MLSLNPFTRKAYQQAVQPRPQGEPDQVGADQAGGADDLPVPKPGSRRLVETALAGHLAGFDALYVQVIG